MVGQKIDRFWKVGQKNWPSVKGWSKKLTDPKRLEKKWTDRKGHSKKSTDPRRSDKKLTDRKKSSKILSELKGRSKN